MQDIYRDTKCDPRCWKKIICKGGVVNSDETVIDGVPLTPKVMFEGLEMQ